MPNSFIHLFMHSFRDKLHDFWFSLQSALSKNYARIHLLPFYITDEVCKVLYVKDISLGEEKNLEY